MNHTTHQGFAAYFQDLADFRSPRHITFKLQDLLLMAVMAIICGADSWVQVQLFVHAKRKWLADFMDLSDDLPSHDTFARVFARLDPQALEQCFLNWMQGLVQLAPGRLVAIDGKSLRNSFRHAWDKSGMAHMVSAFVSQGDNHLVFSQLAVQDKSNEIVAIPKLLALLDLKEAVVTIDAMGCQREIARQIVEAGGDYVLTVKDNQPTLHQKIKALCDDLVLDHAKQMPGASLDYFQQQDDGHGRLETRRVWVSDETHWLGEQLLEQWPGLDRGSVVVVERTRQDLGDLSGKVTLERHYYISSLGALDAKRMAEVIRGHWGVENRLHWQLDVSFKEDGRRVRIGHAAENFSRLCRMALNLLKRDKTAKGGIDSKRLQAGWDNDYLLHLIHQ